MSLAYEIFASMESEASDHTPKTIGSAVDNFHVYFKEFKEKAEEVSGRLYAMIKKLTGEGSVNAEIKYLKARLLDNPSQLVINVSEHIQNEIIFNEKVCKYDTKTLNHPIAKRCCEQHVQAIKQLLDNEKSFDTILKNAASTKDKADDKVAIQMLRNLKQVGKHLLWSSKRLLANIRIHQSSNEGLLDNISKAFKGRKEYHDLFDFEYMQQQTAGMHKNKPKESSIPNINDISADEASEAKKIFERIAEDVDDYDYPHTAAGVRSAAEQRYHDEMTSSSANSKLTKEQQATADKFVQKAFSPAKRSSITLSEDSYKKRVTAISTRLDELKYNQSFALKSSQYDIKYWETNIKNISKVVNDPLYVPCVKKILSYYLNEAQKTFDGHKTWYEYYIKEYDKELQSLKSQASK